MQSVWEVYNGMKSRMQGLVSENRLLRKRNQALETQVLHAIANERSAVVSKQKELADVQRVMEDQRKEINSLNVSLDQERLVLDSERKTMQNAKKSLQQEIEFMKRQKHQADLKILDLQHSNNSLKEEQGKAIVQKSDLMADIQSLRSSFESVKCKWKENEMLADALKQNVDQVVSCNKDLECSLRQKMAELEMYEEQIAKQKQSEILLQNRINELLVELSDSKLSWAGEVATLKFQVEDLSEKLSNCENQKENVDKENAALEWQLLGVLDEISKFRSYFGGDKFTDPEKEEAE